MQSRGVPWALACAFGDGTRRRCGENGTAEDPGTVRQRVECLDLTSFRRNPECSRRHSKKPRGIVEVKPRFDSVVSRLMDGDAVMGAQRGDTLARPAIAIAGHQPVPVQDAGDEIVVGDQHQLAYGGNHIGRGAGALPAPPPGQAYLGVDPANPMDEQNDLGCSRGCSCSAGYDAALPSSGGSIYARIGDSGAGPPTKRRRAWAHHGDGWWVRCC